MREEKEIRLYSEAELSEIAAHLYDGGWRKEDQAELMQEYGLERETAEQICDRLREIEREDEEFD